MMKHGGDIKTAAEQFSIPESQWLDLSTAISPYTYPLPPPPQYIWERLPYTREDFINTAKEYYQCDSLAPVAGSQQAIELLPQILSGQTIAVPLVGYSEHETHWRLSSRKIKYYANLVELQALVSQNMIDIAVVINPNNPTGELIEKHSLVEIAKALEEKNGYLIADEAFVDPIPQHSLARSCPKNVIILRSIGKFFGLAGIRTGFVIANPEIITKLEAKAGLWRITGPSQWATVQALQDISWQQEQIHRLNINSILLYQQLTEYINYTSSTCQKLFVTIELPTHDADMIFRKFAQEAILLRKFNLKNERSLLRVGLLPLNEDYRHRFYKTLDICYESKLKKLSIV